MCRGQRHVRVTCVNSSALFDGGSNKKVVTNLEFIMIICDGIWKVFLASKISTTMI